MGWQEGWRASCCTLLSNSSSRSRGWAWQGSVLSQRCCGVHWLVLRAWSNHKALMGSVEKGQPGSTGWCSLVLSCGSWGPSSASGPSLWKECVLVVLLPLREVTQCNWGSTGSRLCVAGCEHSSLMGLWAPQQTSQGGQSHICCSLCPGVFCLFRLTQEITL